jgi:hypothetical protein
MTHARVSFLFAACALVVAAAHGLSAKRPSGEELRASAAIAAPQAKARKKKKPSPYSMTGCLQKGDNNLFRLTNVEGGGSRMIEITGAAKTVNLGADVGHRVQITGITVNAKKAAKAEGKTKKEMRAARALYMRVRSVKMVAPTCS